MFQSALRMEGARDWVYLLPRLRVPLNIAEHRIQAVWSSDFDFIPYTRLFAFVCFLKAVCG